MLNTISLFGCTAGAMSLPLVIELALEAYGYEGAFVIFGGIVLNSMVCGATIRKPETTNRRQVEKDCITANAETQEASSTGIGVDINRSSDGDSVDSSASDHESKDGISCCNGEAVVDDDEDRNMKNVPTASEDVISVIEMSVDDSDRRGEVNGKTNKEVKDKPNEYSPMIHDYESDDDCSSPSDLLIAEKEEDTRSNASCRRRSVLQSLRESFIFQEPIFSLTLPANFLLGYVFYAWMFFLVPNAQQRGISRSQAVLLSTIAGVGGIAGRITFVALLTIKFNPLIIYIVVGVACSCTFLLDFVGSGFEVRAVLALIQGACFFVEDTYPCTLAKELVQDERNFSFAIGISAFFFGAGATVAGFLTGVPIMKHKTFS